MLNIDTKFDPFSGPELECVTYTTKSQSEIWTACYFGGDDAARAYNESITMDFNGPLNAIEMDRAIQTLVDRHESLRATFSTDGVYMSIFKQLSINLTNKDLSHLEEIAKKQVVDQYINEDSHFLFDLVNGPLIKFGLLKLSDDYHKLVITAHHIICDGWSIGIMLQDLGVIYSAYVEKKIPDLEIAVTFSDYANEEQLFSKSEESKEIEKFWYDIYKSSVPVVNIPTDFSRPSVRTYKSKRLDFTLDANLIPNLKQTGLSVGASFVTTLLTCFELFLYQITGQDDLVVGLPYAGQPINGMNHLIGHCVNLLPLRSKPQQNMSFSDYLKQRKSEIFDAYDYPKLSFGSLLQQLNVARDPSRIPLVPIVFNMDMGLTDGVYFSNLTYTLTSNPKAYDAFEIALNASGTEKSIVFEWSYNEALYKPETIQKMMVDFENIAQKIIEDSSKTLGEITFQDYTHENDEINTISINYPNSTLHELFAESVEMFPNLIAVEFNDEKITYGELDKLTNQMANYLWSQGLRSGQIVAVSLDKSPELIVVIYAILQCGAIYLPLDTEYPENRIQNIIIDSEASFFISRFSIDIPANTKFIDIDCYYTKINNFTSDPIKIKTSPESIAYIIYTSGSTGKPKGVQISHKNVVNFVYSIKNIMAINEKDKFLSVTSISFDPMVFDVFVSLLLGASVVFIPRKLILDGRLLLEKIIENKITAIASTPSLWQILIDSGWKNKLNLKAITGGEVLHKSLANSLLSKCSELWNLYGPTETTVASFMSKVSQEDDTISIGKPIGNTFAYLLDTNKKPVKYGEIGEIAIGGDGVSLGYLKQQELTDKLFIKNTTSNKNNSTKLYLTGDLAKILPNGDLHYIGRADQQVKIRGYRIEIGEIEHALMSIDNIKLAIVLANNDNLIAFIVLNSEITDQSTQIRLWRNELTSQLPYYMVPGFFHILEKIPTTQNDKIDRKALLEYKCNSECTKNFTAPRTEAEKIVANIWKEVLKIEKIDIYSNFFEIGGHSIMAVKVMSEVEKHIDKRIPVSALFEHSTIEKFAKLLNPANDNHLDHLVPIKPNGTKPPLFIVHGAGLNILNFSNVMNHFDEDQPIYGFQGVGPNGFDNWFESIEAMASRYVESIVKVHPNGPYAIGGFSFGGIVAFEIARQLKQQDKKVSTIAILDTYITSSLYYTSYSKKKLADHVDKMRRWMFFLKEICTSWDAFKLRTNAKKEYLLKKYFGLKEQITEQEALALEEFTIANKMVNVIVDRYHLIPQDVEVELFRAENDEEYKLDPTHLGWKKAALKGVNIHNIPGNHLNIVAPPNDKILARMLQDILDKKHAKN